MRIGIFTLAGSTNYGGALQTYALSEYLKSLGHMPEIVMVHNTERVSSFRRMLGVFTTYTFKELCSLFFSKRILNKYPVSFSNTPAIQETFKSFYEQNLHFTEHIELNDLPKFVHRYDAIITGSDQVWTNVYSNTLYYFFDSMENFTGKRISYAACSAHSKAAIYNRKKLRHLFQYFDAISVRDEVTRKLVKHYSRKPVQIVADPTLLYDFDEKSPISVPQEPYIFCYILGEAPKGGGHLEAIKKIKRQMGDMNVVAVNYTAFDGEKYYDKDCSELSPFEWVNLIRNANVVYTNSFHAILFSLRFHKPVFAYYTEAIRASRLIDLKAYYHLGNSIVDSLDKWDVSDIDWTYVDSRMQTLVSASKEFLRDALS